MALQNCCCCNLKTGVMIIATLGWVFTLIKLFGVVGAAPQDVSGTLGVRIGYAVVSLISCILMIVGVSKENRFYLLPWLILDCLECILVSILTIVFFALIFHASSVGAPVGVFIAFFFILGAFSALCWYLWVVVLSYFIQLRDEEAGRPSGNTNYTPAQTSNPPPYNKNDQMV